MNPYPRLSSFDVDPIVFSVMIDKVIHGDSNMPAWIFDEDGEVFPEDRDRYDALMEEWYEDGWDNDDYHASDDMDGDWDTGMTSAGWGTDEDYGYFGEDY